MLRPRGSGCCTAAFHKNTSGHHGQADSNTTDYKKHDAFPNHCPPNWDYRIPNYSHLFSDLSKIKFYASCWFDGDSTLHNSNNTAAYPSTGVTLSDASSGSDHDTTAYYRLRADYSNGYVTFSYANGHYFRNTYCHKHTNLDPLRRGCVR